MFELHAAGFPSMLVAPINHAGHHTHQMTICVVNPDTFQPNAASLSAWETPTPRYLQAAQNIEVGANRFSSKVAIATWRGFPCIGCTCDKGVAKRPISSAKEKLSVASDDKNIPSNSSENDFMSSYCCMVGLNVAAMSLLTRYGSNKFRTANTATANGSSCNK